MPASREVPDEMALRDGVRLAMEMYVQEASLQMAVGETGLIKAGVEIFLERGHARHSKGSCYFERRLELKGG